MREGFLLDPEVAYFNHGGYGACPVEVFEEYQRRQLELERDPTAFFTRRFEEATYEARAALAAFVGARTEDLVFATNATSALNAVIRSLRIRPNEEILTTKHEYGAILRTLGFIRANVVLVEPDELIANIGIRTRAIVVSHITSPTALVLPVEDVCAAARRAGVLSVVDGAHVLRRTPEFVDEMRRTRLVRSTRTGSSLWSSVGATTTRLTSASATAGREPATPPRASRCRRRSSCTQGSISRRRRLLPTRPRRP